MVLDLSLPESKTRRRRSPWPFLLWLPLAGMLAILLARSPGARPAPPLVDRELAETLARRSLFGQAAEVWEELAARDPDPAEALFRAGLNRRLAGEPERALRDLYAAEHLGLAEEHRAESNRAVLECLASLGRFAERNEELKRRTGGEAPEKGAVVARVGEERILRAELDGAVRDEETARLLARGELSREALDRAVAARMADPKGLAPVLRQILTRRVLALEALARGLDREPAFHRRLLAVRRDLLANQLLEDRLLEGIRVTDGEIEDHWKAHPERYTEPEAVRFSLGEDPAKLEEVPGWHRRGDPFPGGARSAEADALLFALKPGEVSDRAVRVGDRELRFRVEEKRPARLRPLSEVRDRVREDLLARKRREAVEALRREAEARHPVVIVDEALRKAMAEETGR